MYNIHEQIEELQDIMNFNTGKVYIDQKRKQIVFFNGLTKKQRMYIANFRKTDPGFLLKIAKIMNLLNCEFDDAVIEYYHKDKNMEKIISSNL